MSRTSSRILISGGGIAGSALAYWLLRHGFAPTVVERAPALRTGGYSIDVRGAAIEVADRMGVLSRIREARTGMRGISFRAGSPGRSIDVPVDALVSGEGDYNVEIARDDLSAILHEAAGGDAEYVFGDSIRALHQRSDRVDVEFGGGRESSYDLVVGADGLHSATRRLAFGPAERFYRHLGAYIAIFDVDNHLGLDHWALMHNVPGRLAAIYAIHPHRAKAILAFRDPEPPAFDPGDEQGQKRILADACGDMGWEVPALLEQMWTVPDFYFDALTQIRMEHWWNGRAALVGDAGYGPSPVSGQGTSLALVGAYVLAGELARAGGDHRTAFAAYENRMRGFVAANQRLAGSGGKLMLPATRGGLWVRDRFVQAAPLLAKLSRFTPRGLDSVGRAAVAIDLPDYPPRKTAAPPARENE